MKAEKYTDFFEEAEKSMSKDSIRRAEGEANKIMLNLGKGGTAPDYFHSTSFFLLPPAKRYRSLALGRKPPRLSLPVGPTRTLIGLIEKGSLAIGLKPPVTKAIIDKYTEDIAVEGSLIQKELGFMPQYDLKTGWEETIREMQGKTSAEC
jgi:hypothetical protein